MEHNQSEELSPEYIRDFYNKLGKREQFDDYSYWKWFKTKSAKAQYDTTINTILKAIETGVSGKVLEIGIGDGAFTHLWLNDDTEVDAIDISSEMLAGAKIKFGERINYILGDITKDHLGEEKYDYIFAIRCIEYMPDKALVIKKSSKLLTKNGKLLLITKNPHFLKLFGQDVIVHSGKIDIFELADLLEANGFKVRKILPAVLGGKEFHLPVVRNMLKAYHNKSIHTSLNREEWFRKFYAESFLIYAEKEQ